MYQERFFEKGQFSRRRYTHEIYEEKEIYLYEIHRSNRTLGVKINLLNVPLDIYCRSAITSTTRIKFEILKSTSYKEMLAVV